MIPITLAILLGDWTPGPAAHAIRCKGSVTVVTDGKPANPFSAERTFVIDDRAESIAGYYPEFPATEYLPFRAESFEEQCTSCSKFWKSTSIYLTGRNGAGEDEEFSLDRVHGTLKISERFKLPVIGERRDELIERRHAYTCQKAPVPVLKDYSTKF